MNAAAETVERALVPKHTLVLRLSTDDDFVVRRFSIRERMSELFQIQVIALSHNQSIDFDKVLGRPAAFFAQVSGGAPRVLDGICNNADLIDTSTDDHAAYRFDIVPRLWLATQRRNHRIFQHMSDPDIVCALLEEWEITYALKYDASAHKSRKYRVQYGETDYAFMRRLLEDAGIAFYFDRKGVLVLTDVAETAEPRPPVRYNSELSGMRIDTAITNVHVGQRVRSTKYTIRDHDYRRGATFALEAVASTEKKKSDDEQEAGDSEEAGDAAKQAAEMERLERFHYVPGAFLFASDQGVATPNADDRGKSRHDPGEGAVVAKRRLDAKLGGGWFVTFDTTDYDIAVGDVVQIGAHPHPATKIPLLVIDTSLVGDTQTWRLQCDTATTLRPYRPALSTKKPRVSGIESATVVGPAGQEIHTDEFGRVRVQFHWDREGTYDEKSSCWIHVSQSWAGATFGGMNLPRVGQEVLVDFLGGDPDRPVIVGRVYTNLQRVPYPLPENKTKSGWRSQSTPGGQGYNEIMFDDEKGAELFSMHAERDMETMVEHDQTLDVMGQRKKFVGQSEHATIGASRTEQIGDDESLQVGGNRSRKVGGDETVNIGGSRVRNVAMDDTLTVGGQVTRVYHDRTSIIRGDAVSTVGHDLTTWVHNDRAVTVFKNDTRVVGADLASTVAGSSLARVEKDETTAVGGGATRSIGGADALSVGGAQSVEIGEGQSVRIGADHALEIGTSAVEKVGHTKATTVAGACSLAVGAALAQTVAGASTEAVGTLKEIVAGKAVQLQAGTEPRDPKDDKDGTIALLKMQESGELLLGATSLELTSATFHVEGKGPERALTIRFGLAAIEMRADGRVSLSGTSLSFNGSSVGG